MEDHETADQKDFKTLLAFTDWRSAFLYSQQAFYGKNCAVDPEHLQRYLNRLSLSRQIRVIFALGTVRRDDPEMAEFLRLAFDEQSALDLPALASRLLAGIEVSFRSEFSIVTQALPDFQTSLEILKRIATQVEHTDLVKTPNWIRRLRKLIDLAVTPPEWKTALCELALDLCTSHSTASTPGPKSLIPLAEAVLSALIQQPSPSVDDLSQLAAFPTNATRILEECTPKKRITQSKIGGDGSNGRRVFTKEITRIALQNAAAGAKIRFLSNGPRELLPDSLEERLLALERPDFSQAKSRPRMLDEAIHRSFLDMGYVLQAPNVSASPTASFDRDTLVLICSHPMGMRLRKVAGIRLLTNAEFQRVASNGLQFVNLDSSANQRRPQWILAASSRTRRNLPPLYGVLSMQDWCWGAFVALQLPVSALPTLFGNSPNTHAAKLAIRITLESPAQRILGQIRTLANPRNDR